MSASFLDDERLADLLIQQATSGLPAAEAAELERLLATHPDAARDAFEREAAALTLAARLPLEPLPESLRERLLAQGTAAVAPVADLARARRARDARPGPSPAGGAIGWWAAAAAVLLAVAGWYPRLAPPAPPPSAAELRERLLASHPEAVHWDFTPTADPGGAGASGDVVFDPQTQQGYLRFRRLGPNDPHVSQYQLWIFDAQRDDRFPVDGGVFDVPAGATEVVVPITARVRVGHPALFAVTVERPGGVVVSAREHIVVVAKPTAT